MILNKKTVILVLFFFLLSNFSYSKIDLQIIMKINDQIVTTYDLEKESNYLLALNPKLKNISENDLLSVKDQFLKYSIHVEDANQNKTITYSNVHFDNNGVMQVLSDAFPGAKDSKSVTTFTEDPGETGVDDSVWHSESISAEPGINGNEAVHTAAIYTDSYVGDVKVQVTLDNDIGVSTNWADVATVTLNNETAPVPVNFVGVFNYVRFEASANPADKISKILVRN